MRSRTCERGMEGVVLRLAAAVVGGPVLCVVGSGRLSVRARETGRKEERKEEEVVVLEERASGLLLLRGQRLGQRCCSNGCQRPRMVVEAVAEERVSEMVVEAVLVLPSVEEVVV